MLAKLVNPTPALNRTIGERIMSKQSPDWATVAHDDIEPGIEVRLNGDGTIDEIVTHHPVSFHLEQMDDGQYWIGLNWTDEAGIDRMQHVMLTRHGKFIYPTVYC